MLPNPSRFSINGVSFAVSSVDVLFHLRKEEYTKRASEIAPIGDEAQPPDAMGNLCRHVLQQRRQVLSAVSFRASLTYLILTVLQFLSRLSCPN